jgi:hypothetical protein
MEKKFVPGKRTVLSAFLIIAVAVLLAITGCKKASPSTPEPTAFPTGTWTASAVFTSTLSATATPTGTVTQTFTQTATATNTPLSLEVTGVTVLNAGTYEFGNVHISSGGTLRLAGPAGASTGALVTLVCLHDFTIDAGGTVDGNGAGYAGDSGPGAAHITSDGGGHGGQGGKYDDGVAGSSANDSGTNPVDMGSGSYLYSGGAFFKVVAANNAVINGNISMNGNGGLCLGAGAGGTIYIKALNISGNGSANADGNTSSCGGGGGGGIVLFSSHGSNTYTGALTANGGAGSYTGGIGIVTVNTY